MSTNASEVQLSEEQLREALRRAIVGGDKALADSVADDLIALESARTGPVPGQVQGLPAMTQPVPVKPGFDTAIGTDEQIVQGPQTTTNPRGAIRGTEQQELQAPLDLGALTRAAGEPTRFRGTKRTGPSDTTIGLAERGVNVHSDLGSVSGDAQLRTDMGYAPNDAFRADFLAKHLGEKFGLQPEGLVRVDPQTGELIFFNPSGGTQPGQGAWEPVDKSGLVTANDFRDMWGPAGTFAGAITGAMLGLANPIMPNMSSAVVGATGMAIGELYRLTEGRRRGVHDLDDEAIIDMAMHVGKLDAIFGVGSIGLWKVGKILKGFMAPKGMNPADAKSILDNIGRNQDDIDEINHMLKLAGSEKRLKIDPVAEAENDFGLAMRESAAAGGSDKGMARRAAEIKANESALVEYAAIMHRVDPNVPLTHFSEEAAARDAQAALRDSARRIQMGADDNLVEAEIIAREVLTEYGQLNVAEVGESVVVKAVSAHHRALQDTQATTWNSYTRGIGQPVRGDPGWSIETAFTSSHQIPITPEVHQLHKATQRMNEQRLIAKKARGGTSIKDVEPTTTTVEEGIIRGLDGKPLTSTSTTRTNTIDLAVLDDDIKTLRAILRDGDTSSFNMNEVRRTRDVLVKMRNEYLEKNHPGLVHQLEEAELASTRFHEFTDESVFAGIFKENGQGKYVADNVAAFNHVFGRESRDPMRQLVAIAKQYPGGMNGIERATYQLYKKEVIPRGANLPNKALHDKFVLDFKPILDEIWPDQPHMYRFGAFAQNVDIKTLKADKLYANLQRSPLAKFADRGDDIAGGAGTRARAGSSNTQGVHPENMSKRVFSDTISVQDVRDVRKTLGSDPALLAQFDEAVGRHLLKRMAPDGVLKPAEITRQLNTNRDKLMAVFGWKHVQNLERLVKGINLNRLAPASEKIGKTSPFGLALRAIITPPLTKRGRLQTLAETVRFDAVNRFLNDAVRDPKLLEKLARMGNVAITEERVVMMFAQAGASTALLQMDDADLLNLNLPGTFVDGRLVEENPDAQVVRRK